MKPNYRTIVKELQDAIRTALKLEADRQDIHLSAGLLARLVESERTAVSQREEDVKELKNLFKDPPLALVAFDTPGIQEYIFKADRPVEIYGASRLIADFTDKNPATNEGRKLAFYHLLERSDLRLSKKSVVYAGGGGGLLVLAASQAATVTAEIERRLKDVTGGQLRSATATLLVWPDDLSAEPTTKVSSPLSEALGPFRHPTRYGATVAVLMAFLARERSRVTSLEETISSADNAWRCISCNNRLISEEEKHQKKERQDLRCKACQERRWYGGRNKTFLEQARTFKDLTEENERAIAVIYADGANVGRAFQMLENLSQHRALSEKIDTAFRAAVEDAVELSKLAKRVEEADRKPIQTPVCGGDDLVLIVPAKVALSAAKRLINSVEASFDAGPETVLHDAFKSAPAELKNQVDHFGVGVGVAIADFTFPIQFLLSYASQLLKNAKKRIRQGDCRSAMDFMVLSSGTPLCQSMHDLRSAYCMRPPTILEPGLLLTERPFSKQDLERFASRAQSLVKVPTSQIHALGKAVRRGYKESLSLWRYQHARANDGQGWAWFRGQQNTSLDAVDGLLWRDSPAPPGAEGTWKRTDLLDAIEILPFLGKPETMP